MFIVRLFAILSALLLVIAALLLIIARLLRRLLRRQPAPTPIPSPPQPAPCPPPRIPDTLTPAAVADALRARMAGIPADGSAPSGDAVAPAVIWVEAGDEVLVHLDSMTTSFLDRIVLVSVDLESDQTGRSTIVVPFALGAANDPAALFAVTEESPRGDPLLVARWGRSVQNAAWASLLALARDHAEERSAAPRGFTVARDALRLHAGPPLSAGSA